MGRTTCSTSGMDSVGMQPVAVRVNRENRVAGQGELQVGHSGMVTYPGSFRGKELSGLCKRCELSEAVPVPPEPLGRYPC